MKKQESKLQGRLHIGKQTNSFIKEETRTNNEIFEIMDAIGSDTGQISDFKFSDSAPFVKLPSKRKAFKAKAHCGSEHPVEKTFYTQSETCEFRKFLFENEDQLTKILMDDINYDLRVKTGCCITFSIIQQFLYIKEYLEENFKMLLLIPDYKDAVQLGNKKELDGMIGVLHSYLDYSEIQHIIEKHSIIVSTYDGLKKLIRNGYDPSECVLVLDNFHNLINRKNSRLDVINHVVDNQTNFKKIIRITLTPEGEIEADEKKKCIRIEKASDDNKIVRQNYSIMAYNSTRRTNNLMYLANHIRQMAYAGKVIVFLDNKKSLKSLYRFLMEQGYDQETIFILNNGNITKKSVVYKQIKENGCLPEPVRIVLAMSDVNNGIEINNEDIDAVYLFNIFSSVIISQLLDRFRNGFDFCFDFIPANFDLELKVSDFKSVLQDLADLCFKFSGDINEPLDIEDLEFEQDGLSIINDLLDAEAKKLSPIYYKTSEQKYKIVDIENNNYEVLNHLHESLMRYPAIRKTYLKLYMDLDPDIEYYYQSGESLNNKQIKKIILSSLLDLEVEPEQIQQISQFDLRVQKRYLKRVMSMHLRSGSEDVTIRKISSLLSMQNYMDNVVAINDYLGDEKVIMPKTMFADLQQELKDVHSQKAFTEIINDLFITRKIAGNSYKIISDWDSESALSYALEHNCQKK